MSIPAHTSASSAGPTALVVIDAEGRAAAIAKGLRAAARKSRAPTVFVSGGGGFKARKGARLFFYGLIASFLLIVLLPTAVVSIYYAFIATDQYATETRFSLRSGETSVFDSLSGIAGLSASEQSQNSQVIVAFIKSRAMVEAIDQALDFRKLYSREDADYLSRFDPKNRIEEMVKYWNRRVDAQLESQSGIITVEVRAFTAEESLKIAQKIVQLSEDLINQISERSRQAALKQSREELNRAQRNLQIASDAMRNARNTEGILDVGLVAEASMKVMTALKIELTTREQEFAGRAKDISADAPQTRILAAQIANIKSQIARINDDLARRGESSLPSEAATAALPATAFGQTSLPKSLAGSMNVLERFQVDLTLSQQQYASAALAYETARVEMETQHAYLNAFMMPTLAQKALYPKRLWNWSIIVFPDLLIWLTLLGLSLLIRDNMI